MTRLVAGEPDAENWQAYLDGVLLEWCIEADDVEGYAIVYDGTTVPSTNAGEILTWRLAGNVEFRAGTFDKWRKIEPIDISL